MTTIAITREVSPSVDRCELTHQARRKIDAGLAIAQHELYKACLIELGCRVLSIPGDADLPDCVFVEDTAIVLDEVAVQTRPGAVSRRAEVPAVRQALEPFRRVLEIRAPGVLDGGDVLMVGRTIYAGRSSRTNDSGIDQLARLLEPYDYAVRPVEFRSCLHLKSAVTLVADRLLLLQADWVSPDSFDDVEVIRVDPDEPAGGNALRVGETVIYASSFERTRELLESRGLTVRTVDQSELAKAEGGVTCCSLVFESHAAESASDGKKERDE